MAEADVPRTAPTPVRPRIELRGLTKRFRRRDGESINAVDDINLDVDGGEFLILLGPSGCGKTTLLRLVAGLESPDGGTIAINGVTQFDRQRRIALPPERRPINMVFQSYGLWPHMTVFNNIAYPLRNTKVGRSDVTERVNGVMRLAGIDGLQGQYPTQLSGGQQQRVALARAVVSASDVVLFDEPLSNVDAKVRDQLRIEILRLQRALGFTAIYVTHDQDEAMALGTRIAVLENGRIAQLAPPREIYEQPATPYVARFVGTVDESVGTVIERRRGEVDIKGASGAMWTVATSADLPDDVVVMSRPERWQIGPPRPEQANVLNGEIQAELFLTGSRTELLVSTRDGEKRVWAAHGVAVKEGDAVSLTAASQDLLVFGADDDA